MKTALFDGRSQKLTFGRIEDFKTTYNLACNPNYTIDESLLLFKDGYFGRAQDKINELDFLGKLDGIVIGIAGADHPLIEPEQIPLGLTEAAQKFFDPKQNTLTYFQRMILIKRFLTQAGLSIEKIDLIPTFPSQYYPTLEGKFQDPSAYTFQYFGSESYHHFHRIIRRSYDESNLIVLYHNYMHLSRPEKDQREMDVVTSGLIDEIIHKDYIVSVGFSIEEKQLDNTLLRSEKENKEAVLVISYQYPLGKIKRGEKIESQQSSQTPFLEYQSLKQQLLQKGVDLSKVHISFFLNDPDNLVFSQLRGGWFLPHNYLIESWNN